MRSVMLLLLLMTAPVNLFSQGTLLETGFYKIVEKDSCSGAKDIIVIKDSGIDYCINKNPIITDAQFESVNIVKDTTESGITYAVSIMLDSTGTRLIKEATEKMVGQKAAFIINNKIVAAPTVRDPITTGRIAVFCNEETIDNVRKALKSK